MSVTQIICTAVLSYFGGRLIITLIALYSEKSKYFIWARRLYWPIMRKEFIRRVKTSNSILVYPLLIHIELTDEVKNTFIQSGFEAAKDNIVQKMDTISENIANSMTEAFVEERNHFKNEDNDDFDWRETELTSAENKFIDDYQKNNL